MHAMPNKRIKRNTPTSLRARDSACTLNRKNEPGISGKKSGGDSALPEVLSSTNTFLGVSKVIGRASSTDIPSHDHIGNDEHTNVINNEERIEMCGDGAGNRYGNVISLYNDLKEVMELIAMYKYGNNNEDGGKETDEVMRDSHYMEDLFRDVARNMIVKYKRRNVSCEVKEGFYLCNECMERYIVVERHLRNENMVSDEIGENRVKENENNKKTIVSKDQGQMIKIGGNTNREKCLDEKMAKNERGHQDEGCPQETREGVAGDASQKCFVDSISMNLNDRKLHRKTSLRSGAVGTEKGAVTGIIDKDGAMNMLNALKIVSIAGDTAEKRKNLLKSEKLVDKALKVDEMIRKKDGSTPKADETSSHNEKKVGLNRSAMTGPAHFKVKVIRNDRDEGYFVYKPKLKEKKGVLLGFDAITNEIMKENKTFNARQGSNMRLRKVLADGKDAFSGVGSPVIAPVSVLKVVKSKVANMEKDGKVREVEIEKVESLSGGKKDVLKVKDSKDTAGEIIGRMREVPHKDMKERNIETKKIGSVSGSRNELDGIVPVGHSAMLGGISSSGNDRVRESTACVMGTNQKSGAPRVIGVSFKVAKLDCDRDVQAKVNLVKIRNCGDIPDEKTNTEIGETITKKRLNELRAIYDREDDRRGSGISNVKQSYNEPEERQVSGKLGDIGNALRIIRDIKAKSNKQDAINDKSPHDIIHRRQEISGTNPMAEPTDSNSFPAVVKSHKVINLITPNLLKANDLFRDETEKDKSSQLSQIEREIDVKEEIIRREQMNLFSSKKNDAKNRKVVTKGRIENHGDKHLEAHIEKIATTGSGNSKDSAGETKDSVERATVNVRTTDISSASRPVKNEEKKKNMYQMMVEQIKDTLTFKPAKPQPGSRESSGRNAAPSGVADVNDAEKDNKTNRKTTDGVLDNKDVALAKDKPVAVPAKEKADIASANTNISEVKAYVGAETSEDVVHKVSSVEVDEGNSLGDVKGSRNRRVTRAEPSKKENFEPNTKDERASPVSRDEYDILTLDELREYRVRVRELIDYFEKLIAECNAKN